MSENENEKPSENMVYMLYTLVIINFFSPYFVQGVIMGLIAGLPYFLMTEIRKQGGYRTVRKAAGILIVVRLITVLLLAAPGNAVGLYGILLIVDIIVFMKNKYEPVQKIKT